MQLALAMILDALFGEPDWLWRRVPHPAVLMGRVIAFGDRRLNRGRGRRLKGLGFMLVLLALTAALGLGLAKIPSGGVIEVGIAAILLAQKSLVQHVRAVANALGQSLAAGRHAVSMIVGRDTGQMREPEVARAAIESAAENLSDGVIAPAFWFLVAGLPGIMVYKMANTADSMIGHMTPRHRAFGWAAARIDDLLNLIPARLTALLMMLAHGWLDPRPVIRDARLHRSPNAGWPESALAPILNVALSGPRSYDGRMQDFPWVWPEGRRDPGPTEIRTACHALWRVWGLMLVIALGAALL